MAQAKPTGVTLLSSLSLPLLIAKLNERGIVRKELTFKVGELVDALAALHPSTVTTLVPAIMVSCLDDDDISLQNVLSESVFALVQSVHRHGSQ